MATVRIIIQDDHGMFRDEVAIGIPDRELQEAVGPIDHHNQRSDPMTRLFCTEQDTKDRIRMARSLVLQSMREATLKMLSKKDTCMGYGPTELNEVDTKTFDICRADNEGHLDKNGDYWPPMLHSFMKAYPGKFIEIEHVKSRLEDDEKP